VPSLTVVAASLSASGPPRAAASGILADIAGALIETAELGCVHYVRFNGRYRSG
jgi:hypothetical protein